MVLPQLSSPPDCSVGRECEENAEELEEKAEENGVENDAEQGDKKIELNSFAQLFLKVEKLKK